MQWYKGAIHEAIATAKARKKIFLVYIEGTDEASKNMSEIFNNPGVQDAFGDDCISVKLEETSVECQQFRQIYPIVTIPSTFFIGTTGVPLEISAGSMGQSDFISKIQKARELHRKLVEGRTDIATPSHIQNATSHQSSEASQAHHSPESTFADALPTGREMPSTSAVASGVSSAPLEDRVERAKQLLAEKKEQRMREEAELEHNKNLEKGDKTSKEKQKELEYRKMGKEVQKSRAQREQQEMQEWAESRKKEREEERLARERVRAQIAQDRAERAAKSIPGNVEETKKEDAALKSNQGSSEFQGDCIRIQLRLPDGASAVREFPTSATLADVQQFIVQDVRPPFSRFSLTTTFPRRQFHQEDFAETLVNLGLAPSAVILLVPEKSISLSGPRGQTLWALLSTVLSPVVAVWTYLTSFFTTSRPSTSSQQPIQSTDSRANSAQGSDQSVRRRQKTNNVASYRRDGNIHRLPNSGADTDEDNNTWNGNSTQQL